MNSIVERSVQAPSAAGLATAVGALVLLIAIWGGAGGLLRVPIDFTAFRCAGLIVAQGRDPYRVEPLRKCENDALAHVGRALPPHLVVPAPLPPFALLPFGAFGPLTPPLPSAVWAICLFIAFVVTCRLVVGAMRGPPALAVGALLGADLLASLLIGQAMPLEIGFLALAGFALRRGRHVAAAVGAALSMFEPQLGVPAIVALALWDRRARWPLAAALAVVFAISLCPAGLGLDLEYVGRILPAQARAEGLDSAAQFSLSAQLAALGWQPTTALCLGAASYVALVVLGIFVGRTLAWRYGERALAVFAPVAFALMGGVYAHIHQIGAALLLGLLLVGRVARWRSVLLCGILLVATPWQTIAELTIFHPVPHARLLVVEHLMDQVDDDDALAAGVWGVWVAQGAHTSHGPAMTFAEKLPTWIGLLLIAFVSLSAAYGSEGEAEGRRRSELPRIEGAKHPLRVALHSTDP
jgi:hypothetical protein